jgi:hypothetical protein
LTHPRRVYGRWAGLLDAGFLRLGDVLELALFPQVGFELGEDAEHIEEALAGGRRGIDRRFGGLQRSALSLHLVYGCLTRSPNAVVEPSKEDRAAA